MAIYAIDIGGSSTKVGVVENGILVERGILHLANDLNELISLVSEKYELYKDRYNFEGMAISAPGSVDSDTGIIYGASALSYIHGPNLKELFTNATGLRVAIENDANCAALCEAHYGKYKDATSIGFIVIGSGIGGGFIYNKEVIRGAHLFGGELGYTIVKEEEERLISLSDVAGFVGMLEECKRKGLHVENGKELFNEAECGNKVALKVVEDFYKYLAIGIYNLQYSFDPEVILLAGAVSSRDNLLPNIKNRIEKIMMDNSYATLIPNVACATFGADSNLLGAVANFYLSQSFE